MIHKQISDSVPKIDNLSNRFFQALKNPFIDIITILIEVCWKLKYYPRRFKAARTIALHKLNKGDYGLFKVWRSIVFFNTINKLIKTTTAKRLRDAAETHTLLFDFQIGTRLGRSTETALELLTEEVHTVWKIKKIAILLSLDLSSTFDRVLPTRIYQMLRTRRIPE